MPFDSLRQDHWDLMFEFEGVLETWALDSEPSVGQTVSAIKLVEHRLAFLEFEGALSGGRGLVRRIWRGTYRGELNLRNRRSSFQLELERELGNDSERLQARFQEVREGDWVIEFRSQTSKPWGIGESI
jgi:hypothetical protein